MKTMRIATRGSGGATRPLRRRAEARIRSAAAAMTTSTASATQPATGLMTPCTRLKITLWLGT